MRILISLFTVILLGAVAVGCGDSDGGSTTPTASPPPPSSQVAFEAQSIPNGTLGVSYSYQLRATGGVTPYTFTVTAGNLPPGLTLSSLGVISGTPTLAGRTQFTLDVESNDRASSASLTTAMTVDP